MSNTKNRPGFASAFDAGAVSVADVLAFHRARHGEARMEAELPAEAPEGVSAEEWDALGDPGKKALVRERARASKAESDLAALRTQHAQPTGPGAGQAEGEPKGNEGQSPDLAAIIQKAVDAAITPLRQERSAEKVAEAMLAAAQEKLQDPSDALAHIPTNTVTDANGRPDEAKVTAAIEDLVKRKPHLAKITDSRRRYAPDAPLGGGSTGAASVEERTKAALARMQAAAGVKIAQQ